MKTTLSIKGMSCDHCVQHLTKALKGVSGVTNAQVSLKQNSADVEHSGPVSPEALKAAVEEAGFEVA